MSEHRKLAAVMFTDIVGYTAMMSRNEQKALAILEKNRTLQKFLAKQHNGEFLKEMGDGTLLCFHSALDALRCAIEIQESVKDDPDLNLRIGIHLGDIVFKDGDVFGDGVNVASRIEKLAESGGICISDHVYQSTRNQPGIDAVIMEEKRLKNVDHPVKIYQIIDPNTRSADRIQSHSDKNIKEKSIIVLPFVNISPDTDQEYFSDGLTEEIITDLSHIHDLLVISRSSAMTFKGSKKKITDIAGEVSVRYVLEGSVRKAGNNLRITAQLIDSENDAHLWAEKYSGTLDEVFDIQEKVSREIVDALKLKLTMKEKRKLAQKPIENSAAYECYLRANAEIFKFTEEAVKNAIRHFQEAIQIIGDNTLLYTGMAWAYWNLVNIGAKQESYLKEAEEYIEKALMIDPDFPKAHTILGWIDILRGNMQEAVSHLNKALKIHPDETLAMQGLAANIYSAVGRISALVHLSERLMVIDPLDFFTNIIQGMRYFYVGQFDKGLVAWKRLYELYPQNPIGLFLYAMILIYNNRSEEAFEVIDQNKREYPDHGHAKLGVILKYALKNKKQKVKEEMTVDFIETCQRDAFHAQFLAGIFSLLDEKKTALDWLENAINHTFINYPFLNEYDPLLENIRGEERFKKLMKRVKKEWENFEV